MTNNKTPINIEDYIREKQSKKNSNKSKKIVGTEFVARYNNIYEVNIVLTLR